MQGKQHVAAYYIPVAVVKSFAYCKKQELNPILL